MKRPRTRRNVAGRGSKRLVTARSSRKAPGAASTDTIPGRINPQWIWHYRILLSLRERLEAERRARLAESAQPLAPHSMDPADSATDELDHNVALATLSAHQDALRESDAALNRIRIGTYGVCEETGQPIPRARLKVIPWTRFVRPVEAQDETTGGNRPPHLGPLGSVRGAPPSNLKLVELPGDTAGEASLIAEEIVKPRRPKFRSKESFSPVELKSRT